MGKVSMKMNMKQLTTMIMVNSLIMIPSFSEDSAPLLPLCPIMSEDQLQTVANEGKVTLDGKSYDLITHNETHNNYNGRLIETKEKLTDLLKETKEKPTVTLNINSHQNPMMRDHQKPYCAYKLEREKEEFVIALRPSAEEQKK